MKIEKQVQESAKNDSDYVNFLSMQIFYVEQVERNYSITLQLVREKIACTYKELMIWKEYSRRLDTIDSPKQMLCNQNRVQQMQTIPTFRILDEFLAEKLINIPFSGIKLWWPISSSTTANCAPGARTANNHSHNSPRQPGRRN